MKHLYRQGQLDISESLAQVQKSRLCKKFDFMLRKKFPSECEPQRKYNFLPFLYLYLSLKIFILGKRNTWIWKQKRTFRWNKQNSTRAQGEFILLIGTKRWHCYFCKIIKSSFGPIFLKYYRDYIDKLLVEFEEGPYLIIIYRHIEIWNYFCGYRFKESFKVYTNPEEVW